MGNKGQKGRKPLEKWAQACQCAIYETLSYFYSAIYFKCQRTSELAAMNGSFLACSTTKFKRNKCDQARKTCSLFHCMQPLLCVYLTSL